MFERYTERARRVLFFARYEATQLGSTSIETEHLLLGLIRRQKHGFATIGLESITLLALYAAAVWKMFRRPALRVELHHVPSGTVAAHEHTPESLARKVEHARSIMRDARRAASDHAERGPESPMFPAVTGPLCAWCDLRAHCPEGQAAGPEKPDWAALDDD